MMNISDALLNLGLLASLVGILISVYFSWKQFKADGALAHELWEAAQKKQAVAKLRRLQAQLQSEAEVSKSLQSDFDLLLREAIKHLESNEKKFVKKGINQPSFIGRRNYELKIISHALTHATLH